MVYAILSIGILGFIVWSHLYRWPHLFLDNHNPRRMLAEFELLTLRQRRIGLILLLAIVMTSQQEKDSSGSSEALCKTSFDFTSFYQNYKFIDPRWLEWFIGFTEGDGAILESKGRLSFVIGQKDVGVLYHIQEVLGFGMVNVFPDREYGRYAVWDSNHIALLIHLFNGNLVLPKRIDQLKVWLAVYNSKRGNIPIIPLQNAVKLSLNSAWICGFSDAECCFNIHITKRPAQKLGFRIKPRFLIVQQFSKECLEEIRVLFNTGQVLLKSGSGQYYTYTTDSFKGLAIILDYFNKFPLKTTKQHSFKRWSEIYNFMVKGEHLTKEGFNKIQELAKEVNKHPFKNSGLLSNEEV